MGANPATQRNGNSNRKLRAEVLRLYGPTCHLCGRPIDLTLKYPHPMSYEVDHLVPVARGGPLYDPDTCRPAHRRHNGQRGDRSIAYGREAIKKPPRRRPASERNRKPPTGRPPQSAPPKPSPPSPVYRTFRTSRDWFADLDVTDLTW